MMDRGNETEPDLPNEDPFDPDEYYGEPEGGGGGHRTPPPPPAIHALCIQQWEIREGKNFPYVNLAIAVVAEGMPYDNSWIWEVLSYSPKSKGRWAAFFKALGWTPEYGTLDRSDEGTLSSWFDQNTIFYGKTKMETYRGQSRAKIAYYIPADEAPDNHQPVQAAAPPPQRSASPPADRTPDHRPYEGAPGPGYDQRQPGDVADPYASDFEQGDDDDVPF